MTEQEINCPSCGSNDVEMTAGLSVIHSPPEHNWYGQCHVVGVPFRCTCGQEYVVEISAYKCRASLKTVVKADQWFPFT